MWPIVFVAVGGAIGASLRYTLSTYIAYRCLNNFPLGTLLVNILGCLVVGYLLVKGFETGLLTTNWRLFLIVGIGGAFTTFSSFSFETVQLMREGFFLMALLNIMGNLFLCLLATSIGIVLAKIG
jgi:CrcB protein